MSDAIDWKLTRIVMDWKFGKKTNKQANKAIRQLWQERKQYDRIHSN